jgi:4-amino-4-deoxychorismate lyase
MRWLVDGIDGALVDPLDRGLQYGDGLFETIAVLGGRPRFFDWHFERLADGASRLGISMPGLAQLREEIDYVAESPRAVVKVILTRGNGMRGYRPPPEAQPRRIVACAGWPDWPPAAATSGARLGWCRTRLGRNPALAGLKHLNRLEQVLARAEWDDAVMDEALMCDDRDDVVSATQANLFARIEGRWVTPKLDECGVAGIMRRAFRHWRREQGEEIAERPVARVELASASALLLTNALIGAWPIRELAGRQIAVDPVAMEFNAWLDAQ